MSSENSAGPIRMIITLGLAGLFSGLVIVSVFLATQPLIKKNQEEALEAAIYRVLPGSETRKVFIEKEGKLAEADSAEGSEAIFAGYNSSGKLVGYGIPSAGSGFQDTISLIYGYNPFEKKIIGMQVLESRETPGLGDKIIKDLDFLDNFTALEVEPEILSVASGTRTKANEVDSISGATISSKAVVKIINQGNQKWKKLIDEKTESEGQAE
jgi:H+/Na+-translocating ferredoxin:NAD+ oxidoreductase subunit G